MNNNKNFATLINAAIPIFRRKNSNTEAAGQFKGTYPISTNPGGQLEGCLVFDAKLEHPVIFVCLKSEIDHTDVKSNMVPLKSIIGVSEGINIFQETLSILDCENLENNESCYDFLQFIGNCNKFIATFHTLDFNTPAYRFDRIWSERRMDEAFEDINQSADDNFAISWLKGYETALSKQIAEAGHHESVDLLIHLQGDFIEKLVGFDGATVNNDGSLRSTLVDKFGKENAIKILTNLLRSI
jgi:hypothetical protein